MKMKNKVIYLVLYVLSTLTLFGCGKADGEKLAEENKNSIIQFNQELVTDNTMYVVEEYIYPTAVADYVLIEGQMDVNITSIECPNGKTWIAGEYSTLDMFETYDAADEPYLIHFKETFTGDTNTLQVYCYTKEQAVEKGLIADVIPFTFKDFIVDGQMNVVEGKTYSTNLEDYITTSTIDTIEITEWYGYIAKRDLLDDDNRTEMYSFYVNLYTDPFLQEYKLTITDTSCDYSQELYINVYNNDADTTGVLLAPSLD